MWKLLRMAKLPLTVLSLLLGIALSAYLMRDLWTPFNPLVGDLVLSDARLPGDLINELKARPEQIKDALAKSKELKKLLPGDNQREEVTALLADIVDRYEVMTDLKYSFRRSLLSLTVRNEGSIPLRNIKVGFKWESAADSLTIFPPDGPSKVLSATKVINLGDLPPLAEIKMIGWGSGLMGGDKDITLSHDGGVGKLNVAALVPAAWYQEGIFITYRQTTLALLALILIYLGIDGVAKQIAARKAAPKDA